MKANPDDGWHNPRVLGLFAVIFFCGLVCGAAAMNVYVHTIMVRPVPVVTARRLQDELHMSPEQRQEVDRVLDDYAKYFQNVEEQRESVAELGKQNILRVLKPDQQKRFLKIFQFPTAAPCAGAAASQ